jgi:3-methyl-2-oxobutanoate hydroxymethyltransferase
MSAAAAASGSRPVTVPEFRAAKARGAKLAVVTAYDYTTARICDEAGVEAVLVGDSLGMVVQGQPNALSVTLGEMIYHSRCVTRGVRRALVIADLPFLSYQVSPRQAVRNAGRLLKEGGAQAVKLEGGVRVRDAVRRCVDAGIPVMGHIGLTPQAVHQLGGFKVQRDAEALLADATALQEAGVFALVVESVPADLAARVTASVSVPTIGIGAGPACDGQVLVLHDLIGLFPDFQPKFVKRFAELGTALKGAVEAYCREVRAGTFPAAEHAYR